VTKPMVGSTSPSTMWRFTGSVRHLREFRPRSCKGLRWNGPGEVYPLPQVPGSTAQEITDTMRGGPPARGPQNSTQGSSTLNPQLHGTLDSNMRPWFKNASAYSTSTCLSHSNMQMCVLHTKTSKCQNSKKYSRRRKSERDGSNQISTFWVVAL